MASYSPLGYRAFTNALVGILFPKRSAESLVAQTPSIQSQIISWVGIYPSYIIIISILNLILVIATANTPANLRSPEDLTIAASLAVPLALLASTVILYGTLRAATKNLKTNAVPFSAITVAINYNYLSRCLSWLVYALVISLIYDLFASMIQASSVTANLLYGAAFFGIILLDWRSRYAAFLACFKGNRTTAARWAIQQILIEVALITLAIYLTLPFWTAV